VVINRHVNKAPSLTRFSIKRRESLPGSLTAVILAASESVSLASPADAARRSAAIAIAFAAKFALSYAQAGTGRCDRFQPEAGKNLRTLTNRDSRPGTVSVLSAKLGGINDSTLQLIASRRVRPPLQTRTRLRCLPNASIPNCSPLGKYSP